MRKSAVIIGMCGLLATGYVLSNSPATVRATEITQEQELHIYDITPPAEVAQTWLLNKGVIVPEDIRWECEAAGNHFSICPELLEAIAWKESRFTPDAQNGAYVGIMQMHKTTHAERLSWYGNDPYDLHASIWAAASLIHDLSEDNAEAEEPLDVAVVIGMYHGEDDPYTLSGYTRSILEVSAQLERAHGK